MARGIINEGDDFDIDDFGGDDASEDAPFSWRLDGSESFSDWTIVVTRIISGDGDNAEGKPASETYHVHKNILAVGLRKSEYFVALFQSQLALSESQTSTTEVELEDTAADAFPAMLDYIYEGKEDITVKNAVAVRYLSRYFRIRRLFEAVTRLIQSSKDFKLAGEWYLPEAYKYHDEKLIEALICLCARDIEKVGAEVISSYPPDLFVRVLASKHLRRNSQCLSKAVIGFYSKDQRERNDEVLLELLDFVTDEKIMPFIDAETAAFVLLEWDMLCQKWNPERNCSLRGRCIDAISKQWQNTLGFPLDVEANENKGTEVDSKEGTSCGITTIQHRQLNPTVQIELLERALREAYLDMKKKDREIKILQPKHNPVGMY